MACTSDAAWIQERIDAKKALLAQYEAALTAFDLGVYSYSFDTGQSRQTVTRTSATQLAKDISRLEDEISVLMTRLCGGGRLYSRPGF